MATNEPRAIASFDAVLASRDGGRAVISSVPARRENVTAGTARALTDLSTRHDEGQSGTQIETLCHDRYSDLYDADE